MKNIKRISCLMLALMLALCMGISSFARATSSEVAAEAGNEVEIAFTYEQIMGINGTFTFSNPDMIAGVQVVPSTHFSGSYGAETGAVWYYAGTAADCTITLTVTLAADVQPGDTCTVNFNYETTANGDWPEVPVYSDDVVTITVTEEEVVLDYSALEALITRADGLNSNVYTPASWANMTAVLTEAKALVGNATTQAEIDAMTARLQTAIESLVAVIPDTGDMTVISLATLAVGFAGAMVIFTKRKAAVR